MKNGKCLGEEGVKGRKREKEVNSIVRSRDRVEEKM